MTNPRIFLLAVSLFFVQCEENDDDTRVNRKTVIYDFEDDLDGWQAIFSDYPVDPSNPLDLQSAHEALPDPLDNNKMGFMISGNNSSDDLFMGLKKQVVGLDPNTVYTASFDLEIASNAPESSVGVGGSPGASVFVKAGATTAEPTRVIDDSDWYRMSIDKGNQAQSGEDMKTLGSIGTNKDVMEYTIITRTSDGKDIAAQTDASGSLWLIVGTESGFEATTTLYYDKITVELAAK
jgi:hypothetical protein